MTSNDFTSSTPMYGMTMELGATMTDPDEVTELQQTWKGIELRIWAVKKRRKEIKVFFSSIQLKRDYYFF